jgi:protein-disulfide isomerase
MSVPMRTVTGLALAASIGLAVFVASSPRAQTPASAAPQATSKVVATVDGQAITEDEVDRALGAELGRLEQQIHEMRQRKLDDLIAERLLEREAARRNVPVDALVKAEVTDKITPVTEDEVTRFFEANKARLPAVANIRDQIRRFLEGQQAEERREAFVGNLRGGAKVSVSLAAPAIRRAEINVAGAPVRGDVEAPVTIVEFSDFHCPYCRTVQPTLLQLLERYPGKVRLVYKDLPLDGLHPSARKVSEAARCASDQGKFWEFHDAAYSGAVGTDVSAEAMKTLAGKAGVDLDALTKCLDTGQHRAGIQRDIAEAERLGLSGTPAFFVNGRLLTGAQPVEGFAKIIDEEIAALQK